MFDLRISGIIAGVAFVLSLAIGLISKSSLPMLVLRPVIFAALFFIISALVRIMISRFLPELLNEGGMENEAPRPGSRINITEGDGYNQDISPDFSSISSKPSIVGARPDDSEDELGNISDLIGKSALNKGDSLQTGMDQTSQDGYTEDDVFGAFPEEAPLRSGSFAEGSAETTGIPSSVDVLPDLDSMAGAFIPSSGSENPDNTEYSISTPALKPSSSKKAPSWAGDFNAKEMAAGLRTVLSKEKEG